MNTHDGDMTSINVILAAAPAGIARPQVAGMVGAWYMRDPKAPPGDCAALGMPVAAHPGPEPGPAAATAAVIRRRSGPWALTKYFYALTKCVAVTGWMSGFLPSNRALAVDPVNRKTQNRTFQSFHPNSTFYRTQPHMGLIWGAVKVEPTTR